MLHTLVKYSFYFTLSFFVLSIPLKDRTLFDFLSEMSSPYVTSGLGILKKSSGFIFQKVNKLGKKLFSNSTPQYPQEENGGVEINTYEIEMENVTHKNEIKQVRYSPR